MSAEEELHATILAYEVEGGHREDPCVAMSAIHTTPLHTRAVACVSQKSHLRMHALLMCTLHVPGVVWSCTHVHMHTCMHTQVLMGPEKEAVLAHMLDWIHAHATAQQAQQAKADVAPVSPAAVELTAKAG